MSGPVSRTETVGSRPRKWKAPGCNGERPAPSRGPPTSHRSWPNRGSSRPGCVAAGCGAGTQTGRFGRGVRSGGSETLPCGQDRGFYHTKSRAADRPLNFDLQRCRYRAPIRSPMRNGAPRRCRAQHHRLTACLFHPEDDFDRLGASERDCTSGTDCAIKEFLVLFLDPSSHGTLSLELGCERKLFLNLTCVPAPV